MSSYFECALFIIINVNVGRGGTRWRWVASFTPRPIYTHGNNGSACRTGGWVCLVDRLKRKYLAATGIGTPDRQPPAS